MPSYSLKRYTDNILYPLENKQRSVGLEQMKRLVYIKSDQDKEVPPFTPIKVNHFAKDFTK